MIDGEGGEPEALDLGEFPEVEVQEEDAEPVEETVIAFADEGEEADETQETPLVKRLREQLRDAQKRAHKASAPAADNDPEPTIPARPRSVSDFEYDEDRFAAAFDEYEAAKDKHAAWARREEDRKAARQRIAEEQTKKIQQQRNGLGVADYDARAALVQDRLSEQQLAVLIEGADNPAKIIYALGRSEARLEELAEIGSLAKFAARLGQMEKEIKVTKRTPPAPETRVSGGNASVAIGGTDKELERLEREADKTGDRTKVYQYKRELKRKQAA